MRSSYLVTFCLRFGVLLLCIPLSCSATQNIISYRLGNTRDGFYLAAMHTYRQHHEGNIFFAVGRRIISTREALVEIKMEMRMSPAEWDLFTKGYMRENFDRPTAKDFIHDPSTVVASFLAGACVRDESRRTQLLFWAVNDREFTFLAECLEEQMGNRHWHAKHNTHPNFVENYLLTHWIQIYTYSANFCKTTLILSLIEKRGWPVPTRQNIMQCNHLSDRYKLQWIRSLKRGKKDFASAAAFHILNNPLLSSPATISARECIYKQGSLKKSVISAASKRYWKDFYYRRIIFSGGDAFLDLLWGVAGIIFSSKIFLFFFIMSHLIKLNEDVDKEELTKKSIDRKKSSRQESQDALTFILYILVISLIEIFNS